MNLFFALLLLPHNSSDPCRVPILRISGRLQDEQNECFLRQFFPELAGTRGISTTR